jgi:myo-inositol 2-dehydrogenase/D-chiro-inositol 1-dehydrogenase
VKGTIHWVSAAHSAEADVRLYSAGGVSMTYTQTFQERFGAAYRAELADFVRCIVEGNTPEVTGEDGLRALEIGLAATCSQREGRAVLL